MSGVALMGLNSLIRLTVLPYCTLVLLSTSEGMSIVSGILLSVIWLRERWLPAYNIGVPLIVLGAGITICNAAEPAQTYSWEEAKRRLGSPQSVGYIACSLALFCISLAVHSSIRQ